MKRRFDNIIPIPSTRLFALAIFAANCASAAFGICNEDYGVAMFNLCAAFFVLGVWFHMASTEGLHRAYKAVIEFQSGVIKAMIEEINKTGKH